MDLFQISCFLSVAEYLNFTKAAESLHVTHPAVSQQIKSLEKELGTQLFARTTRSVRLTEAGRAFVGDARQMAAIAARAKKRFEGAQPSPIEPLSVGCSNFPSLFLLTETFAKLRLERPNLHPRLQVIPFQHIYRLLDEGDLDAVAALEEPGISKPAAQYRELARSPIVCVCPAGHPLAAKSEVSPPDLRAFPLVLFALPHVPLPVAQLQGALMEDRPLSDFYFCESAEALSVLVQAGYGVSVLPELLAFELRGLQKIPLAGAAPVSLGIYYKTLQGKPALRDFLRCAKECFSPEKQAAPPVQRP